MISSKLKKMKYEELKKELADSIAERDDTMFDVQSGREKDYGQIKEQKKKVARILTLMNTHKEQDKGDKKAANKVKKEKTQKVKRQKSNKLKGEKDETKKTK